MTDRPGRGQCPDVPPLAAPGPTPDRDDAPLPGALDGIYREHVDFVYRIACQLGAPPAAVEDVVHDVFIVVHRRLHEFDGRSMRSWLYGITRRVVAHELRGGARARRRLAALPPPPPSRDPEDTTGDAQAIALIEAFLRSLDDDQRAVFSLVEIEGCSAVEVAAALGVNVNTIYSRLRLARQRFARLVAAQREVRHG